MKTLRILVAIFVLIGVALAARSAKAGVLYVKADSPGPTLDGKSWLTAYHTVPAAIPAAVSGDEVWVAAGTYVGSITLKDKVSLYGGFAGAETARGQRDSRQNITVLDGNKAGSVIIASNVSAATVVDGFTIKNGSATMGGGICVSSSYLTISNNVINGNTCSQSGGGIWVGSKCVISGNIISGNNAGYGAGIYCYNSAPQVMNNTIRNNTATSNGGGVYLSSCSGVVCNNVITANLANYGGGISGSRDICTIANNTIVSNTAATAGGGMSYSSVDYVTDPHPLANNIIAYNSSGIASFGGVVTLSCNCVYGNTAYNYSNIAAGLTDFTVDPKFVDRASGDYHIKLDSPCLDAGDSSVVKAPWTDLDGESRIQSERVDVGVDEVDRSQNAYVQSPVFSRGSGLCPPATPVIITCATDGAIIHYTTTGIEPTGADAVVESGGSVVVTGTSMTLIAKAWKDGCIPSAAKYAAFTVADTVATPIVTPDGGHYETPVQVTVSCSTTGAVIRYTTDGTAPTETSQYIASGSSILLNGPSVLNVRVWKPGLIPSDLKTSTFTMRAPSALRVNVNASGAIQDGRSWDSAFKSVQTAIDAAITGDEIWVAAGTYLGPLNAKNDVSLYGGFCGSEAERDQRDPRANITALDAISSGTGITYPSGAAADTVLDGFTIRNTYDYAINCNGASPTISGNAFIGTSGQAVYSGAPNLLNNTFTGYPGSAVYLTGYSTGTVTIKGNTFKGNGAALYLLNGPYLVYGNTITENKGNSTGTAINCNGPITVSNNIITNNSGWTGTAIYCRANCTITNNIIAGNTAKTTAAGLYIDCSTATISNNTIVNNIAEGEGGAMYFGSQWSTYVRKIASNIIAFNSSGIYTSDANLDLRSNCIYSNGAYNFKGIADKIGLNGNISANPLIANAAAGDFHIHPQSPCVNAGDNSFVSDNMVDMDGEARIAPGGNVDIGADESYGIAPPYVAVPDFSLPAGVYTSPQNVVINCATPGAVIHYTKDGGEPTLDSPWVVPGGIVLIDADCTLKAKAWKEGLIESGTASIVYRITGTVAPLVFTPNGGSLTRVTSINISSATPGVSIYYTTDGSEPTSSSTPYAGSVTVDRTMAIKAKGYKQDWLPSVTAQAAFDMRLTTIYRVDSKAPGAVRDGASWQTAFTSISDVIDQAIPGDEIWVAKGIYDRVCLLYGVKLYGGFSGIETARSQRDFRHNQTIIDAGRGGAAVAISGSAVCVVDGFTIRNSGQNGPGISCGSSSTIANNKITANLNGGISVSAYTSVVRPTLINNIITGNTGCGIFAGQYAAPMVINNTIYGNSDYGVTVASNPSIIVNNIIALNGGGISDNYRSSIINNCVYNNCKRNYYYVADQTGKNGNISVDPGFAAGKYGDLRIVGSSACRDAGSDGYLELADTDFDQQPRKLGTHVDIGCYESDGSATPAPLQVIRVAVDGSDANDGLTWQRPMRTISEASRALADGGEIWVKSGEYRSAWNVVGPFTHVYGGFRGVETDRSQRDPKVNASVISNIGSYGTGLVFMGAMTDATVDGFTIKSFDTGIDCQKARATVYNNRIYDCAVYGINCNYSAPYISSNTIERAARGIVCDNTRDATIVNNAISCCVSYSVFLSGSSVLFQNNTIVGNGPCGNPLLIQSSADCVFANNLIAFNASSVSISSATNMVFKNNCVYGNTPANYSGVTDPTGTNGNISQDPRLVDYSSRDLRLVSNSPCIDSGAVDGALPVDLAGTPRPLDGNGDGVSKSDIGCYEYCTGFKSVGEAKGLADGYLVSLTGLVSTVSFGDRFYAETLNRISGIGVTGISIPAGRYATIEGRMATIDGERVIAAYNAIAGDQVPVPSPWLMNPNAIGGGPLGLQGGVSDWRFVRLPDEDGKPKYIRELIPTRGANNIGLLIKTTGRVTYADDACFYVDGGAGFDDGRADVGGIRVLRVPAISYIPRVGDRVIVTGISSCYVFETDHRARLIRPTLVELVVD